LEIAAAALSRRIGERKTLANLLAHPARHKISTRPIQERPQMTRISLIKRDLKTIDTSANWRSGDMPTVRCNCPSKMNIRDISVIRGESLLIKRLRLASERESGRAATLAIERWLGRGTSGVKAQPLDRKAWRTERSNRVGQFDSWRFD